MMIMTVWQGVVTVLMAVLGTIITRFLPFVLFPDSRRPPRIVEYLGRVLPYAMTGLLVVYSLKDVDVFARWHGFPEAVAIAVIVALHVWRRNMLLSIACGTVVYMLLLSLA
jgi:branched-subunit amino acid transport protein AzlD